MKPKKERLSHGCKIGMMNHERKKTRDRFKQISLKMGLL
jgi:hypothetical protein